MFFKGPHGQITAGPHGRDPDGMGATRGRGFLGRDQRSRLYGERQERTYSMLNVDGRFSTSGRPNQSGIVSLSKFMCSG